MNNEVEGGDNQQQLNVPVDSGLFVEETWRGVQNSQEWVEIFEEYTKNTYRGRIAMDNPDGTLTYLSAYTFILDPEEMRDSKDQPRLIRGMTGTFSSLAAQAGYELATAPIVIQDDWVSDGRPQPRLWYLVNEMQAPRPHPPQNSKKYNVFRATKEVGEPLVLQKDSDQAMNWQKPTRALHYLINKSPYAVRLREVKPPPVNPTPPPAS